VRLLQVPDQAERSRHLSGAAKEHRSIDAQQGALDIGAVAAGA
jgi:hypothetical protein